ncbi:hypothetical protein NXT3_PB00349 (plasmid) [Sinorhizobium fredii]|uniref:Uncharacterized protein n=1 Tax=Rhizobium fredii TaxID=380 RepID=A0A2L0HC37_RHIFR|nr:hypothetical protein NXT3_PB00349 [Sinorhizobium fredii]
MNGPMRRCFLCSDPMCIKRKTRRRAGGRNARGTRQRSSISALAPASEGLFVRRVPDEERQR